MPVAIKRVYSAPFVARNCNDADEQMNGESNCHTFCGLMTQRLFFSHCINSLKPRYLSNQNVMHDFAVDVRQTEVATGVFVGEFFVIDSEQMEHC